MYKMILYIFKAWTGLYIQQTVPPPHNNMLYVRYLHLTKATHIRKRQTHPHVREEVAYKDYDRKGSCVWRETWWITRNIAPIGTNWRYTTTHKVTLILNIIYKNIRILCSKYSNSNDSIVSTYQNFRVTEVAPYWFDEGSTAFVCSYFWFVSTHTDMAQIRGKGVGCCYSG